MQPTRALCSVLALSAVVSAQQKDWPYSMDYGPYLMTTFDGRGQTGFTYKAVVVRLPGGAVAFDTELLRLSAAWTDGFLHLRGTAYDGSHGPMPSLRGHKVAETKPAPGWARNGELADPRSIPHGPLPKEWGAYRGLWLHGDRVALGYRIDDMEVVEAYGVELHGGERYPTRTLNLGPSSREQWLVVLDGDASAKPGGGSIDMAALSGAAPTAGLVVLQWPAPQPDRVETDVATGNWERLAMGGPSQDDHLDAASGTGAVVRYVPGFARPHGAPKLADGAQEQPADLLLPRLHDGLAAQNDDDWQRSVWFDKRRVGNADSDAARIHVDLQQQVPVTRVSTFSWHKGGRATQKYLLFASDAEIAPDTSAADPGKAGWQRLCRVNTDSLGAGDKHGVSCSQPGGLGRYRHLLFVLEQGSTFFSEIDVFSERFPAAVDRREREPLHAGCGLKAEPGSVELVVRESRLLLRVPPHARPLRCKLVHSAGNPARLAGLAALLPNSPAPEDLAPLQQPAEGRWGDAIVTKGERGKDDGPFATDTIAIPFDNRFGSRMRVSAFDFFRDGRAAITTWNGDVWLVSGLDDTLAAVRWQRFATGLHDPLGLRIVDDVVYVHGRDGITRLHDGNGDGEADFYECFNHDVTVTNGFHEFAFDLQTDADGNFYCSKGAPVNPGGRGFMKIVPHHGTIMKISKDGSRLDVIATGLRAPNGIGVSPSGVVTSGDNEGTFMPRCRLNWFTGSGFYGGVKDTSHRNPVPDQPDLPLCWFPMEVDNSSGGQVWVTSPKWQDLDQRLLHLSYGTCSVYLVLDEDVEGQKQGGVVKLGCSLSSSAMRARFHPVDGELYVAGFQGWQTSAAREGGFHRVRRTTRPLDVPTRLRTCEQGVYLTFAQPLDAETAEDKDSYGVEIWNYLYSPNYGSPEISILHPERKVEQGKPNRDPLPIRSAKLSPDGCTVFLAIDGMRPVQQMKVTWNVDAKDGTALKGELHNSIHALAKDPGFPPQR